MVRGLISGAFLLVVSTACSSTPSVKTQAFAPLRDEKVIEHEFPVVWKAIERTLVNHRVVDRDPAEVDALEMQKLVERKLETDWIYGRSRDKYQEYTVNELPKKTYLQIRYRHTIVAKRVMGGTSVGVSTREEVERLKPDGTSDGYSSMEPDSSRGSEIIEKINLAILSGGP